MQILDIINCPLCASRFHHRGNSIECSKGHVFDVSKEGYVNLLPPGRAGNSSTGDDKVLIRARNQFLEKDYYSSISDKIAEVADTLFNGSKISFCDMGSGVGYHTCRIAEKYNGDILGIGFDASKYGSYYSCRRAGRKKLLDDGGVISTAGSSSAVYFVTANIFRLPVYDHLFDFALSMFAPIAWNEAFRILKDDGMIVVVSSGTKHLDEMRKIIYENVEYNEKVPEADSRFELLRTDRMQKRIFLDNNEDIMNLFAMTPFYYKTNQEGKKKLSDINSLGLTIDVNINIFRKR